MFKSVVLAAGLGLGMAATAVHASPIDLDYQGLHVTPGSTVKVREGSKTWHVYAGGFDMSDGTNDFVAWCIDLFDNIKDATYLAQRPAQVTDAKEADINRLFTNNFATAPGALSNAVRSAAFQVAIWEIVYETASSYSLGGGNLKVWNNTAVTDLAQTWLDNLGTGDGTYVLSFFESGNSQDLVTGVPGPTPPDSGVVPLPAGVVLLLTGLGALGIARRRAA